MKLIDLLVQELPKRGGWPDGYHALVQESRGAVYLAGGGVHIGKFELADDYDLAEVTREQYEAALAAAQQPVWNGKGLPPVGMHCDIVDPDGALMYGQGESGEVVAHVEDTAVIRMSYGLGCFEARCLRPSRSEADKKREAALDAIYGAIASAERVHNRSDEADKVYEAIAAGKIPGVKLDV